MARTNPGNPADMIRVGKVSSINKEAGLLRVTYQDRDRNTTAEIPMLNFGGEYKLPSVGEMVAVAHLDNDTSMGVVLGTYWNDKNKPKGAGAVFRKDLGGGAYLEVKGSQLVIHGTEVILSCSSGSIKVSELISMKEKLDSMGDTE